MMSLLLFLATNNALCLWLARKNYSFVFGRDAQNEDIFSPRAVRIKRYCRFTIVFTKLVLRSIHYLHDYLRIAEPSPGIAELTFHDRDMFDPVLLCYNSVETQTELFDRFAGPGKSSATV